MKLKFIIRVVAAVTLLYLLVWGIYSLFFKKETVHIAMTAPMSGPSAAVGKSFLQGVNLYLDMINRKGGINGKEIVLDVFDDQNKPDRAAEKALEIINQNRALAVIGHHYSTCSISAGKVYKKYGLPAISPASTNVRVTQDNEWYFRSSFNDNLQGRFLATYSGKVLGLNTVSIIREDAAYGSYLADVFEETSRAMGVDVKYRWEFKINSDSLDQELAQIVNELRYKNDAGVIFLSAHADEGVRLVKLIRDALIENPIVAPDSFASESFQQAFTAFPKERSNPGFYTDGIHVTTPLIFDTTNEMGLKFRESYMAAYKEDPGWHAAFAYDTAMVIVEAVKNTVDTEADRKSKAKVSVHEKRQRIRNYLANLNNMYDAVEGVTGYNFFDEQRDSQKPICIGVYRRQNLISALTQFQAIPNINEVPNFKTAEEEGRVTIFDGKYAYKINVVYTGIKINEISALDTKTFTYDLDFFLWFRYQGDINVHDIEFLNAVDPILLEKPAYQKIKGNLSYRLYHVKGKFRADFLPNLHVFGQHILGVSFRPRAMDRTNLILVKDILGMRAASDNLLLEKMKKDRDILSSSYGWKINEVWFFQDIAEEDLLGDPEHFNVRGGTLKYSRFNVGIRIVEDKLSLRRSLPVKLSTYLLLLSFITTSVLLYFVRNNIRSLRKDEAKKGKVSDEFYEDPIRKKALKFLQIVWIFQFILFFLMFLSSEVFVLDALSKELTSTPGLFEIIVTGFDIIWWVMLAFFLMAAMERFVWVPAENRTHQPIPKIVRGLVSLIILILAIMAIVAFVFNQKLTSLLATSGVIAMIVGLAVQINISNIFSGIAINIERPFKIDDWVKIGSFTEGKVVDINWRTTRVQTRDDTVLSIPNSQASESSIENFSSPSDCYWKYFTIHVDPSHPPERVKKVLLNAALATECVLSDQGPSTRFLGLTAGMTGQSESWAANYLISTYVKDYGKKFAHNEAVWLNVWTHLKHAGIEHVMKREEVQMALMQGIKRRKSESLNNPLAILQGLYIFKPFPDEAKLELSRRMRSRYAPKDEIVVKEGDAGDSLFIVVEGALAVKVKSAEGEIIVARLGAGDFFGEMALLTGEPRTATIVSVAETHLLEITKEDIYPLISSQPEISKLLSEVLAKRKMATESQKSKHKMEKIDKETLATQILNQIQNFFGF